MLDQIQNDLKEALRRGDKIAVSALRMLLSALRYAALEARRELREDEVAAVVQKGLRSRRESIDAFRQGRREDLAVREEAEIAVLEKYLPAQLEGPALEQAVEAVLAELGITEKKELGRAMKEFMARHRGRADGKAVNALIAARLR